MAHKRKKIAVIGLGYVGLPLAVEFGKKLQVVGFDINVKRIEELRVFFDRTHANFCEVRTSAATSNNSPRKKTFGLFPKKSCFVKRSDFGSIGIYRFILTISYVRLLDVLR